MAVLISERWNSEQGKWLHLKMDIRVIKGQLIKKERIAVNMHAPDLRSPGEMKQNLDKLTHRQIHNCRMSCHHSSVVDRKSVRTAGAWVLPLDSFISLVRTTFHNTRTENTHQIDDTNQGWWHTPVIPALRGLRQEDHKLSL
jgi:hypothetical protein